jgi:hypothetical protein
MVGFFITEIWWKQQERYDLKKLGDNIAKDSKLQR